MAAEDFVISRKRKLYKFAKFAEAENCFDLAKWKSFAKIDFAKLRENKKLVVEIGAGSAIFLTKLAEKYPEKIFVALDKKSDRLWQGAKIANEKRLKNIFYVWADVAKIVQVFAKNSVDEIWLTFSDPFSHENYQIRRADFAKFFHRNLRFLDDENYEKNLEKYLAEIKKFDNSSRKNYEKYLRKNDRARLTNAKFLAEFSRILRENGTLNFKTDNAPFFEYSLKNFAKTGWKTLEISRNLRGETDEKFADAQILTSYEERFSREFWPISFAKFERE